MKNLTNFLEQMHQINSKKTYRVEEMLYSFYLVEPLCKKRARDGKNGS